TVSRLTTKPARTGLWSILSRAGQCGIYKDQRPDLTHASSVWMPIRGKFSNSTGPTVLSMPSTQAPTGSRSSVTNASPVKDFRTTQHSNGNFSTPEPDLNTAEKENYTSTTSSFTRCCTSDRSNARLKLTLLAI